MNRLIEFVVDIEELIEEKIISLDKSLDELVRTEFVEYRLKMFQLYIDNLLVDLIIIIMMKHFQMNFHQYEEDNEKMD